MKINDYIKQKFQTFGISLSDADLMDISLSSRINGEGEINEDCHTRVSVAIAKFIPSLLLHPSSVSEGSVSISGAQKESIEAYYSFQCKKYGLKDELNINKPKVKFL